MASPNHIQITISEENVHQNQRDISVLPSVEAFDCSRRAQWFRAAVLGANDGLVSIASLMMGVGAVRDENKAMILTFFAGLFASACMLAIGEFVSAYSQLDIEIARMKRERRMAEIYGVLNEEHVVEEKLLNPLQATLSSALAFWIGALVPLLVAAFIADYSSVMLVVAVVAATTVALVAFGGVAVALGRIEVGWSCARMLVGGWMAMAITFGLIKFLGASGLQM